MITATLSMGDIQEMINDKLTTFDSIVLLNNNTKRFIYRSTGSKKIDDRYFFDMKNHSTSLTTNSNNYFILTDRYTNSNLDMQFFVISSESNLLKYVDDIIKKNILTFIITTLIALIIIILIVNYIFKPLVDLTYRIKSLSKDIDKNFNLKNDHKLNEIDQIQYYFTKFVELIHLDKEKIELVNRSLEQKIKEESLANEKLQKQLFKTEKLAAMGEMIGNIAHQWRQPLSVITTSASGIQVNKDFGILEDKFLDEACEQINQNAQYLSQTIDDFKNFIKGDREKITFNLKNKVDSFLTLIRGSLKNHNINTVVDIDSTIDIDGYPNELIQCFINIFNNAKDIMNEKGLKERYFFITATKIDNIVTIKMKDNGGGIPENIIPSIFEQYFTTKEESKGTGLGLYMTKRIIKDGMDGDIIVQNTQYEYKDINYKGAVFIITIDLNQTK